MWVDIALVLAGLIYAITQNARIVPPLSTAPVTGASDDVRYHVQYLQQLLAVQAAQIANINAIYGFMLPVVLFLLQYVAAPIENEYARWALYGLYSALALIMLAFVGMRRPELYSSDDPLAHGRRVPLTLDDLTKTHSVLHTLLTENEQTLRTKHRALPWVLFAGILVTIAGGAVDGAQGPQPELVKFATPIPIRVQLSTPTPRRTPHSSGSIAPSARPSPPIQATRQPGKPKTGPNRAPQTGYRGTVTPVAEHWYTDTKR